MRRLLSHTSLAGPRLGIVVVTRGTNLNSFLDAAPIVFGTVSVSS